MTTFLILWFGYYVVGILFSARNNMKRWDSVKHK